ncbi:phospholipase D-like domain-containing protein [Micromonospora purpureochromogenes]|uniref:phospholipase D-like domain-containing protein n=1 Tax=Micromonospora purpureochromogenes TaxID=47872 RepID=UPI00332703B4
MIRLIADDTWHGLESYLGQATRKRAAIAYVGSAAADLLGLVSGDLIIIDGSDAALGAGLVDPAVIGAWLAAGVEVRSLWGLHAKVMHLQGRRTRVVIGSANASAHSRDRLREAAVVTDDEGLCAQVIEQLDVWQADSDRIDAAWLTHARQVYRPPVIASPPRASRRLSRLWVGMAVNEPTALLGKAAAVAERLEQRHGHSSVLPWRMYRGDERMVRQGDEVVLVDVGPIRQEPRKNSRAWPPARVARVVTEERRRPVALLVWPNNAGDLGTVSFEKVNETVQAVGGEIDWDKPFEAQSPEAKALRALWRRSDAPQ